MNAPPKNQFSAETEDERWERFARADLARVNRLSKLTPYQLEDRERQRHGEFTNDAAMFDQAREEEGHH